jgi:cytochrome c peroxidase
MITTGTPSRIASRSIGFIATINIECTMKKIFLLTKIAAYLILLLSQKMVCAATDTQVIAKSTRFPNPTGLSSTFSKQGKIDLNSPFFQSLGSNGRTCATCHRPETGWSISPSELQQRFDKTDGTEPIFRTNDGANSPKANVTTLKDRRKAYSTLLARGLIRIGLKIPHDAEFELISVSDPYRFIHAADITPNFEFSLFRRPLPATNLKFLSTVMWDGRETFTGHSLHDDLSSQANNATLGHAQGQALTPIQRQQIVDFESALFTAQAFDNEAKNLRTLTTTGGAGVLAKQSFYLGMNGFLADSETGNAHDSKVFKLYDTWNKFISTKPTDIRAAIARGQVLFNTKPLVISGVAGVNNAAEFGNAPIINGTCSTCHNTPNVGSHSTVTFPNLGLSDEAQRTAELPLYTLRNKATGEILKTTDPGRALISGKWQDINRFKIPTLRGLAARAPYFHNGMAKELGNVVDYYDRRFHVGFDNRERLDLILFLRSL